MWIRVCFAGEIHIIQEKLTKFRIDTILESSTSGDNINNRIRWQTELFLICDDFFKICNSDIFSRVFPEYDNESIVPEFILSRLIIEKGFPAAQLYGLRKIFALINDPITSDKLREYHNYTYTDFLEEVKQYDVFSVASNLMFLHTSLYIDYGTGVTQDNAITENVYVRQKGDFYVRYEIHDEQDITGLRFDPDEGNLLDISLTSVMIDGIEQQANAINSYKKTDEYDTFISADPMYTITAPSNFKVVEIRGKVRPMPADLLVEVVEDNFSLTQRNDSLNQQNSDLTQHNNNLTQHADNLTQHNNNLTQHNNALAAKNSELTQNCENLEQHVENLEQHCENQEQLIENQEQLIENLTQNCENQEQHVENLTQNCENLEQHVENLMQRNNDLTQNITDLYNSRTWRIGNRLNKMFRFIVPYKR